MRNATSLPESADGPSLFDWQDGPKIAPYGPEAAPVSPSLTVVKDEESKTSATCGRRGSQSSKSGALQSSLESKLLRKLPLDGSTAYSMTWKARITPQGRQICALRASAAHKDDRGSFGWQTPTTRDGKGESGKGNRIKRGKNGRLHVANLCDQIVDLGRRDLVTSGEFRCWLMGYPETWDDAGVTAMRSCHRSRRPSSKPAKKP